MLLLLGAATAAAISSSGAAASASPVPAPGIIIVPETHGRHGMILNPNSASPKSCPATSWYEAARRGGKLKSRKLNELPSASAYSAVYRHIDKCLAPIIVRYRVGER